MFLIGCLFLLSHSVILYLSRALSLTISVRDIRLKVLVKYKEFPFVLEELI